MQTKSQFTEENKPTPMSHIRKLNHMELFFVDQKQLNIVNLYSSIKYKRRKNQEIQIE